MSSRFVDGAPPVNVTSSAIAYSDSDEPVTAGAMKHSGAMIALVPREEDAARMVVPDGESLDELHLTIGYFGDAALIPPEVQSDIIACVVECVSGMPSVVGDAFSVSMFNPQGSDPCVVLGVSGDQLKHVYTRIMHDVEHVFESAGVRMHGQHSPWLPHITLAYTDDADLSEFTDSTGPILFDRVRVVFASDVYDIPIGDSLADESEMNEYEDSEDDENDTLGDEDEWDGTLGFTSGSEPIVPNVLIPLEALRERDVNIPGGPGHSLREYWVRGPGASKIRWGTDGSMKRCIRSLTKYVKNPGGLCAEYHHAATGEWPRGGTVPSASDTTTLDDEMLYDDNRDVDLASFTHPVMQEDDDDCPPGYHKMPNGSCMRDKDMTMTEMSPTWRGVLTVEGIESGDGRMFAPNALTWDDLPLPLMWQKETSHGGRTDVSVRVGNIDKIWREPDPNGRADVFFIMGTGTIDVGNVDGAEVYRRMRRNYMRGNSVDVDSVKDANVKYIYQEPDGVTDSLDDAFGQPDVTVYTRGRIRATTLVEIPAFTEARLSLLDDITAATVNRVDDVLALRATPRHKTDTVTGTWDAGVAVRRLASPLSISNANDVFAWIDATAIENDTVPKTACKLPHHEVSVDGTPGAANMTACSAAIGALHGARGGVDVPVTDRRAVYDHLAAHMRDGGLEPPAFEATTQVMDAIVAATTLIKISDAPPRAWFNEPTDVTPTGALTVTSQGRVYGYVAPNNVRHRSFHDRAQYAPTRKVDYARFMGGETIVADGGRVSTGNITMNCGHATTAINLNANEAFEHYDNTCSIVATIRVGENKHGVWMAGALLPDVSPEQVRRIMACRLSGDWRRHLDKSGWYEFVAALLVPVPGFPIARIAPSIDTCDGQLVASTVPVQYVIDDTTHNVTRDRVNAITRRVRRLRLGRSDDVMSTVRRKSDIIAALRARVNGE